MPPDNPTLVPLLLIPEAAKKRRVRRKQKSKGPAVVFRDAKTEVAKTPTGTWLDNVDDCQRNTAVQNLLQTARGASLILWSLVEKENEITGWNDIASGLSSALRGAADDVDATYFARAGELAETLKPKILAALLMKKLAKTAEEGE